MNGVKVIDNGYRMVYFAFIGENYDILKVYDKNGNFKGGLYMDVLAYTKRYGNTIEMLDLFLDIFVFPNGEAFLLDEDELEMALNYRLIDKETIDFAYSVANEILEKLKRKEFPPEIVWKYEWGGTEMKFIKETKDGVLLLIHVQPKAKKNAIEGGVDEWRGRLKVRIALRQWRAKPTRKL